MKAQTVSRETGVYLMPRDKPSASEDRRIMDQRVLSNAGGALFNAFAAAFTAGTDTVFNRDALSSDVICDVKLGMDCAVFPFPILNFLSVVKDWQSACDRHGEIEANHGLIARLTRDRLELEAELKLWPVDDPGRQDRQKEIDAYSALCLQLTARNNALRAQAPRMEGIATNVGSGWAALGGALARVVSSGVGVSKSTGAVVSSGVGVGKSTGEVVSGTVDATSAAREISGVACSAISVHALGLINSVCHLIRAFPEVARAMRQLDGVKAAEHRLADAIETCQSKLVHSDASEKVLGILGNVQASMIPLIANTKGQARIIATTGFLRTVHGASGLALKSAAIAGLVLGPAALFLPGVVIAGMALVAGWLTWQAVRLSWAQTLRAEALKIENQLKNDVAIAKHSLAADAEHPLVSATMAPWLNLIEGCREEAAQGPLTSFLRQAGISEAVIDLCLSKERAAIDLVVPIFSAFKESLLTAMPEVTLERIDALKKCKDPRDVLNGFILDLENPDCPVHPQRNKTLKPIALTNQGNSLTLEDVQRHLSAFKSGEEVNLKGKEGYAAQLLTQYFVDAKDKPGDARKLEKTLLTRVKLFIDLSRNGDERAIACLRGRYPGILGGWKFGHEVVRETAEAYLRSKYDGPGFDEKLCVLACLAKKNALVRWSGPLEWAKTSKVWQPTAAAAEMAEWLANPQHVPSAQLVAKVFEEHRGVSENERGGAVSFLMLSFVGKDWAGDDLSAALKALEKCKAKSLFDNWAMGDAENARAVEYALWLWRGLVPRAEAELNPVQALRSLHARHPQVAQAVLEALMGKRFDVPVLSDDLAGEVRAIRNAYADHFLEGETKGNTVFFIPRKPSPEESKVLANLVKVARKDARGHENWPPALITSSLPLLNAVRKKANPWRITKWWGAFLKRVPLVCWLPITKRFRERLKTQSNAVKALKEQLQRNLDSARQKLPESFSPLWMPEYYVGTEVEHGVRAQRLRSIFSDEPYDEADSTKCEDIDATVNMLYEWSRQTPRGREVLHAIAKGGPIQSRAAMHWLFDRSNLPDTHQEEIRRIAKLMPESGGSSKPFLRTLAEWHVRERPNLSPIATTDDINRHASLKDFLDSPASFEEIKGQFQPGFLGIPQNRSAADLLNIGDKQPVKGLSRSRSLGSEELQKITREIKSRRLSAFSTALDLGSMTEKMLLEAAQRPPMSLELEAGDVVILSASE